jgi:polar amino acid transport system substrate-binding protein
LSVPLLAVTTIVGLAACGSSSKSSSSNTSASTTAAASATTAAAGGGGAAGTCGNITIPKVDGFKPIHADTLTVVTSLPGPGFWEGSDTDPNQIKAGYEYCMAKAFQGAFGLSKITVRNESFDAIVAGTVTDYDLALTQSSITDERKKVVSFTDSYFQSQQGVLIKAGSNVKVSNLDEAKAIQWGVQTGTTAIDMLNKQIKPSKAPHVYQNLADAYAALDAGQIDAVLIDTAINLGEAARSKGKFEVISQFTQPGGPDQYGGIVPKGSTNLTALNSALKEMKDGGILVSLEKSQLTANPADLPTIQLGG